MTPQPEERYRRLSLLGRGGMGEVFLADDRILRRKVAIKVVHKNALANPRAEKLLRREAKAAAALDNPFICKVYEVGEEDGRVFIAMEYIQGETLRQRMSRGIVPVREAVGIAREIADGLEEAGRQHVIHRDLKPSNILLTPQGHVKIMDFGLAKRTPSEESIGDTSGTPEGMVVGTREYMSPEQLRGQPLEPSSDLFALGIILYEMLTGAHPFRKAAAIDTQFAILNDECKDLQELCPEVLEDLCDLVEDLLSKSPNERPHIVALRERLAKLGDSVRYSSNERTETSGRSKSASVEAFVAERPRAVLIAGAALMVSVLALSAWLFFRPEPAMPQARMSALVTWPSNEERASLSPDGKFLTFISNRDGVKNIWMMDLNGGEPRVITSAPGNITAQVVSPDGTEIAYALESESQKLVQTMRLDGGPPTRSIALPADLRVRRLIRWVGDALFLETQGVRLMKLSLSSGDVTALSPVPTSQTRAGGFDVSPDGSRVAFGVTSADGARSLWLKAGDRDATPIPRLATSERLPFFSDRAGEGPLFFESDRSGQPDLWMVDEPGREPRQITFGSNREFIETVSADATSIVFSEVLEGGSVFSYDPRTGVRTQLTAENTRDITPSISADGRRLAFARTLLSGRTPLEQSAIIVADLSADGRLANTRTVSRDGFAPVISPDGRNVAFMTRAGRANPRMNLLNVDSGHTLDLGERPVTTVQFHDFPWYFSRGDFCWSMDGSLYFSSSAASGSGRIVKRAADGSTADLLLLARDEIPSNLALQADRLLFLRELADSSLGGVLFEVSRKQASRKVGLVGEASLLGIHKGTPLVMERERIDGPMRVSSLIRNSPRPIVTIEASTDGVTYVAAIESLAFTRRDAHDVQNLFLHHLASGRETQITSNGIQGVAISPVSASVDGLLVYSQQLRNKDLGIIRLDRR